MVITEEALNRVDQHWAVKAVGDDMLARALEVAKVRTMRSAVGNQMAIVFDETGTDSELVERVATAYEIAAIEGLDGLLYPSGHEERIQLRLQAQAGTYRAYALRRTLPIPPGPEDRVFHVLHLAALAYCGDQWTDLRRWLKDHEREVKTPSVADAAWVQTEPSSPLRLLGGSLAQAGMGGPRRGQGAHRGAAPRPGTI
jgi:hypothetical protein